jgi:hypothetical protein
MVLRDLESTALSSRNADRGQCARDPFLRSHVRSTKIRLVRPNRRFKKAGQPTTTVARLVSRNFTRVFVSSASL